MDDSNGNATPLDGIQDPWELLTRVRQFDLPDRQDYVPQFIDLVAKKPKTERDALLNAGREVFHYRMESARDSLRGVSEITEGTARTAAMFATDDFLAEMVYRPNQEKPLGYLVHRFARPDDPPEYVEKLDVGKMVYYPPNSGLIAKGVVRFPSTIEEYGEEHALFLRLRDFIATYVKLENKDFQTLCCCYILMTWLFDKFEVVPYLRAQGDVGTGKTTLIKVIASVCYRSVSMGGAVGGAPIYRMIDKLTGCTLMIDEADFNQSDLYSDLIKILNVGYQRDVPIIRCERVRDDPWDIAAYECYGPKLLSTRRRFDDTALESRCLSYTMSSMKEDDLQDTPSVLGPAWRVEAQRLRNMLLLWRFRTWPSARVDPLFRVRGAEPRVNQIIQPILASVQSDAVKGILLEMVDGYSKNVRAEKRDSIDGLAIGVLLKQWLARKRPEKMLLKVVTEGLRNDHDLKDIHGRKVGDILYRGQGVTRETRGGETWIKLDEAKARQLAASVGLKLEDFALSAALDASAPVTAAALSGVDGHKEKKLPHD